MARPKKQTVDYFPHISNHSSTMFVLEQRFGNNGYAFWFKLLELLATNEGHYYDCRNPAKWEFLQAKTNLSEEICNEILNLLVKLEAIDSELWQDKVIWSDNFIKGISDVYINRRVEIPVKPSFYTQKPVLDDISTPDNPHIKVNETKVNKTKVNKYKESDFQSASLLKDLILENNPTAKITDSQLNEWTNNVRLIREQDNHTIEEIDSLLQWSQKNNFWQSNILSMGKFREKWNTLWMQRKKGNNYQQRPLSESDERLKEQYRKEEAEKKND